MRCAVLALLSGFGSLANAGLIWKVPDDPVVPGPSGVPKYFSGTNARVYISASSAPQPNPIPGEPDIMEPTITKHELWINGVNVGSWVRPPFRPLSFSASYAYMIDSGAFCAPGDDFITVTLKVWEVGDTSPQIGSYTVPVKNRALSVNRFEWEMSQRNYNELSLSWSTGFTGSHYLDVATPLMTLLNRSNQNLYNRTFVNGQPRYWNGEDFFNAMTGKNLLLLATHGVGDTVGSFGYVLAPLTDRDDIDHLYPNVPSSPPDRELLTAQYPDFPQLKQDYSINPDFEGTFHRVVSYTSVMQGSGLTPFNSTGEPPLQILFSTACFLANDPQIGTQLAQEFLYPYKNIYVTTAPENQAAVFAVGGVNINKIRSYTVSFTEQLSEGCTVLEAVAFVRDHVSSLPEGDFVVLGDPMATAVGAYTGSAVPLPRSAWRSLQ